MQILSKGLEQNQKLEVLSIEWNQIGIEGTASLAEAIKKHPSLKNIKLGNTLLQYLGYNMIMDEGAIAIAKALEVNVRLEKLKAANNQIGDKGAIELSRKLMKNNTLKKLVLGNIVLLYRS